MVDFVKNILCDDKKIINLEIMGIFGFSEWNWLLSASEFRRVSSFSEYWHRSKRDQWVTRAVNHAGRTCSNVPLRKGLKNSSKNSDGILSTILLSCPVGRRIVPIISRLFGNASPDSD